MGAKDHQLTEATELYPGAVAIESGNSWEEQQRQSDVGRRPEAAKNIIRGRVNEALVAERTTYSIKDIIN